MKSGKEPIVCHISSYRNRDIDPVLERNGFCHGMVTFAIPSLGILFRCRADGARLDLEFGGFFSLLKFIKTSLKDEKISNIRVLSSDAEFVFAFTGNSHHLVKGSERDRLLREYAKGLKISVGYVEPHRNQTLISPDDYPSIPTDRQASLKPDPEDARKAQFKPFQRGIQL